VSVETDELETLCRRLRLPHFRKAAPEVCLTAKAQRWEPTELLRVLLTEEVTGRDTAMQKARRKKARFPTGKNFESWDRNKSSISAATQDGLATLEWISRHENLVVCGPSGTGKSHFCEALGHGAVDRGQTVIWLSIEDLGILVRKHRVDDSVARGLGPLLRADLVVVDDIGLLPISVDAAEGLYRLVDAAYEKRSIAISSNLHPSGFDELMPTTIATALVDRLMHHAHVVVTTGESIRLADATSGKGVVPLGS
jgi:DNA replication protein DnaC